MGLPDKVWLRRGEVIAGLGITKEIFDKWVTARLVTPKYFTGQVRAFYEREEVARIAPSPLRWGQSVPQAGTRENKQQPRKGKRA